MTFFSHRLKMSSEILADEKTYFLGKVTWKSVTCKIFLDSLKKFWNRGMLHCLRGDERPCITHVGSDGRKLGQPSNQTCSRTQNSNNSLQMSPYSCMDNRRQVYPLHNLLQYTNSGTQVGTYVCQFAIAGFTIFFNTRSQPNLQAGNNPIRISMPYWHSYF